MFAIISLFIAMIVTIADKWEELFPKKQKQFKVRPWFIVCAIIIAFIFSVASEVENNNNSDTLKKNNEALLLYSKEAKGLISETKSLVKTTDLTTKSILSYNVLLKEDNAQLKRKVDSLNFYKVEYVQPSPVLSKQIVYNLRQVKRNGSPIVHISAINNETLKKAQYDILNMMDNAAMLAQVDISNGLVVTDVKTSSISYSINNKKYALQILSALKPYFKFEFKHLIIEDESGVFITLIGNPFFDKNGSLYIQ